MTAGAHKGVGVGVGVRVGGMLSAPSGLVDKAGGIDGQIAGLYSPAGRYQLRRLTAQAAVFGVIFCCNVMS